jgi:hypothetical protein
VKEVEYIIGIYNNFSPLSEDPSTMGYYFLYLLDQKGLLDIEEAKAAYLEFSKIEEGTEALKQGYIGPFQNTDSLNQFAFFICEKFNAEKISLVSVNDYNAFLETTQSAFDFHRDLLDKGNILQNIERRKKGILSRIFQ